MVPVHYVNGCPYFYYCKVKMHLVKNCTEEHTVKGQSSHNSVLLPFSPDAPSASSFLDPLAKVFIQVHVHMQVCIRCKKSYIHTHTHVAE